MLSLPTWWVVIIEDGDGARLFSEVPCERKEAVEIGCKGNNSVQ